MRPRGLTVGWSQDVAGYSQIVGPAGATARLDRRVVTRSGGKLANCGTGGTGGTASCGGAAGRVWPGGLSDRSVTMRPMEPEPREKIKSQSLYRKYRPQFFAELKGQHHITAALRNALLEERIGHAYLFSGPRGTGKTTTARILAKALNCLDLGADGEPCGKCVNCEGVAAGNFADLIELDAASNNKVEHARDLVGAVHGGLSANGKRKVYVVDEVHMLTTAASNALLKTLEEPPDHVVFILATTDPNKVLPTIRSRTQHLEFTLLTNDELREHLTDIAGREGVEVDDDALEAVVRQGAGSARDAMSKLDIAIAVGTDGDNHHIDSASVLAAFGGTGFERRMAVLQAVADEDVAGALLGVTAALSSGTDPRTLAEELLATTRDAFVFAAGSGKIAHEGPAEEAAQLSNFAQAAGLPRCARMIETIGEAIADMRGQGAPDPRLVLEVAVVRLARREAHGDLDGLMERVAHLEAKVQQLSGGGAVAQTLGSVSSPSLPSTAAAPGSGNTAPASSAPTGRAPARAAMPAKKPAANAPADSAASTTGVAGSRPTIGSFRRDAPTAPPSAIIDKAPVAAVAPAAPARTTPVVLGDVVIAWRATVDGLNAMTRSVVQQAQPISLDDDVVLFGVPHDQFTAVRSRFKSNADEIREELARHLGMRVRFNLKEHDFGLVAGSADVANDADYSAPEELPDLVDLDELVDAPDAPLGRDTAELLMAELGAHVVEERQRGD